MNTAEEIVREIFYSAATNGKAEESIKNGLKLLQEYASQFQSLPAEEGREVLKPALEFIQFVYEHWEVPQELGESYGNLHMNACASIENALSSHAAGVGGQEGWISVDTPPEESGRYWCYVEDQSDLGLGHFQWNCCFHKGENIWTDKLQVMHVTHYKHLPLPPKQ